MYSKNTLSFQILVLYSFHYFRLTITLVFSSFRPDPSTKMLKLSYIVRLISLRNIIPLSFEKKSTQWRKCSIIVVRSFRTKDVWVPDRYLPRRMKPNQTEGFSKRLVKLQVKIYWYLLKNTSFFLFVLVYKFCDARVMTLMDPSFRLRLTTVKMVGVN